MGAYAEALASRREELLQRMGEALARSGRKPGDARLMAVSKTVDADAVVEAIRAGYRLFGENRPQELCAKLDALEARRADGAQGALPPVRFDMIGNLQTNKVNAVLGRAACIHSVSSEKLACAVSSRVERRMGEGSMAAPQPVLLEVNVSGEASKSGFSPEELRASLDALAEMGGIELAGLMTMAPRGSQAAARACFSGLRKLRDELQELRPDVRLRELSMGMSEDFECALEEGSTLVRLGRVVFDPAFSLE